MAIKYQILVLCFLFCHSIYKFHFCVQLFQMIPILFLVASTVPGKTVEFLVDLALLAILQVLVGGDNQVDLGVFRPVLDVESDGGRVLKVVVKPLRLDDVFTVDLGTVVHGVEAGQLAAQQKVGIAVAVPYPVGILRISGHIPTASQ